jgi:hypothetical protein
MRRHEAIGQCSEVTLKIIPVAFKEVNVILFRFEERFLVVGAGIDVVVLPLFEMHGKFSPKRCQTPRLDVGHLKASKLVQT